MGHIGIILHTKFLSAAQHIMLSAITLLQGAMGLSFHEENMRQHEIHNFIL